MSAVDERRIIHCVILPCLLCQKISGPIFLALPLSGIIARENGIIIRSTNIKGRKWILLWHRAIIRFVMWLFYPYSLDLGIGHDRGRSTAISGQC